ncbi:MAG: hypothetical protein PVG07_14515 [Acidobacteriota bacterium]|jgi:hypothetical protein
MSTKRAFSFLPILTLSTILAGILLGALPVSAAPPASLAAGVEGCTVRQVTSSDAFDSLPGNFGADGRWLVLTSRADHVGGNSDHSRELFLFDRETGELTQLTSRAEGSVHRPILTADGARVFFRTDVAPDGTVLERHEALVMLDLATGVETELLRGPFADVDATADGATLAVVTSADPTGGNPDGNLEVFLFDVGAGEVRQVTDSVDPACPPFPGQCPETGAARIDAAGERIALHSDLDLTGDDPPGGSWGSIYFYDVAAGTLERVALHTDPPMALSGDGTALAFPSIENPDGNRPAAGRELYLYDRRSAGFQQATDEGFFLNRPEAFDFTGDRLAFSAAPRPGRGRDAFLFDRATGTRMEVMANDGVDDFPSALSADGTLVALYSKANVAGGNPDGGFETFVAHCPSTATPEPPAGDWLTDADFPDFRFKARITPAGGTPRPVRAETECIPETLCISGAIPGRSELFVRIVGPRPNGRLWPTLVRFSTSLIEVWIEQRSTGTIRYYRLGAATPGNDELPGRFDREGFVP